MTYLQKKLDPKLDPRLHAFRKDLADQRLTNLVDAKKFVAGQPGHIRVPCANLYPSPLLDGPLATQLLLGQDILIFEFQKNYAWIQSLTDHYVGYVDPDALVLGHATPTHKLFVPRSFLYPLTNIRQTPISTLSLGSRLTVSDIYHKNNLSYALLASGQAIIAAHLQPLDHMTRDYVSFAEQLLFTPYLWGGNSAFGIDCSGLVQLCLSIAGLDILRDSDMQAQSIGIVLADGTPLQRGDLVFWAGHVAIMLDQTTLIHANGASMNVKKEPLKEALCRISPHYGEILCFRRPNL